MSTDPYAVLGVAKTATADEIKKAFRKKARTSHPDLHPDDPTAEKRFQAINASYDLLKDPDTRARFDRGEIDATGAERPERRFYRDFAEAPGGPYRTSRGGFSSGASGGPSGGASGGFEDFGDVSDIFADILRRGGAGSADPFGRSGGAWRSGRADAPGFEVHYALEVEFLEAANGAKKRITLPDGENIDLSIPQGAVEGQTIRVRGKGGLSRDGHTHGDLLLTLSIKPHPLFRREGNDIRLTLPITLDEAVLGGKVEVPTIGGRVNLSLPIGASSGNVTSVKGASDN